MSIDGESKAQFYKTMKLRFNKCLNLTMNCPNEAIRAHSVQNATALGFIEEGGHVSELKMKIVDDAPACTFTCVGRNQASTFMGLCNDHDTELFLPIDTKPLDLRDPEQLFLIAYRSVTRELHVVMESAIRMQTTLEEQIKLGKVPANESSPVMMAATGALYKSWLVYRYRVQCFDQELIKGRYKNVLHSIFTIKGRVPVLAASSFFPVADDPMKKNMPRVSLNLIPIAADETAVIFSYAKSQSGVARRRIANVILKSGDEKLLALSTLILDTMENFFLRPSHVASWSEDKRKLIEASFVSTIDGHYLEPKPEFMLF